MIIPNGYNLTEIGVIPDEWEVTAIGKIANFQGGSQPPLSVFSLTKKTRLY